MYDLVADVEHYPDFLPWCQDVRILSRDEEGFVADLVVGTRFLRETFTSKVRLDRSRTITVTYCSGPLSRLSTAWTFKPLSGKRCDVFFSVDFDFRSPLLRAAMTVFFDRALTKMVSAFEERAKVLYG